jgi:hypothetical protein
LSLFNSRTYGEHTQKAVGLAALQYGGPLDVATDNSDDVVGEGVIQMSGQVGHGTVLRDVCLYKESEEGEESESAVLDLLHLQESELVGVACRTTKEICVSQGPSTKARSADENLGGKSYSGDVFFLDAIQKIHDVLQATFGTPSKGCRHLNMREGFCNLLARPRGSKAPPGWRGSRS